MTRRPTFGAAIVCIVLPVVLMLVRAVADIIIDNPDDAKQKVFDVIGDPVVALLAGVLVAMWVLGFRSGMNRSQVERTVGSGLPAIAGILLIVAAGGGFKQMLVDAGVGSVIGDWANGSGISPLVLGWLVAVGVRLATGSATVATITASGIVAGIATDLPTSEVVSARAGHRLRLALLQPCQRCRLLAGEGVFRPHRRADDPVLVGDGDRDLGRGLRPRAGAEPRRLGTNRLCRGRAAGWLAGMEITSGSAALAAESAGAGPDVLLVHAGVTDQRGWASVVDRLSGTTVA